MKRHPALAPLSRDHHRTLLIASQLRRATEHTAPAAANLFLAQWESEERLHFRMEEELVLPAYAAHGQLDHPAIVRMLLDHATIRGLAARIACLGETASVDGAGSAGGIGNAGDADSEPHAGRPAKDLIERLHELGQRLAEHVRLEEREVFPLIEAAIPERELEALGERIAA